MNPIAFTIFGIEVKWYAVIIISGLILGLLFAVWEGKRVGISTDTILDIVLIGTPSAIICARIYYVVFEWSYYSNNKDEIFKIWNGGIAIYGAIIGAVISAYIYCRIKKINVGKMFDIGAFGLLIGQSIGRWGNFVNAEAHGEATSLPWRMYIENISKAVHPTFLYESLWNILGFFILFLYRKKKQFEGEIFLIYIAWYGIGRSIIEGLRTDSLYIGGTNIRSSQILAIISAIICIIILAVKKLNIHKRK
ncbi:MAG: prolipoprotein diacylglyceryl transferase [Clostridia bacterium]|nr:prolipoprotein diacylglyceryl transferase [Clostridia bacterium]